MARQEVQQVWFGLGSNLQRERHIKAAVAALEQAFTTVRLSHVYESEAAGFAGPPFYNLVAWVETQRTLAEVQVWCKQTEQALGRAHDNERFSSKTMDIDILLYNDQVCEATESTPKLPRGEILTSPYVLAPMADLVPYMQHPETGKSYREHWLAMQQAGGDEGMLGVVESLWLKA
ncbi:2-amino-4-hydroxy-6-hydroxymethyldihydropteridine diphosphokinase [Aliidiomarina taiwanensis]|uniref:2-amino-4-hydroxy-6- hydroxymethyldihydropteridine diphosphokinase n=1 Tax=Aliidiomarina taiwanensis TaxID=946228 RepID=UPI0013009015|nr:2-amino-4-hydroxy-6-hydroxymethyldihydropteridine diphosphokinase [Aliidiomarina taiwanensis]